MLSLTILLSLFAQYLQGQDTGQLKRNAYKLTVEVNKETF